MFPPTQIASELYDSIYSRKLKDNYLNRLDNNVTRDPLIEELRCTGFLSKRDPKRYKSLLKRFIPDSEETQSQRNILELGCGFGRLGCWLAQELDSNLIGIDFSPVAIKHAKVFARSGLGSRKVRFSVADFSATGLASSSVIGIVSLDALYLAIDRIKVLKEMHRILVPGGPLLFTVYTKASPGPDRRGRGGLLSWCRTLESTGFTVGHCREVTISWRRQMRLKHKRRWDRRHRISLELGKLGTAELGVSAAMLGLQGKSPFLDSVHRFEIVALAQGLILKVS